MKVVGVSRNILMMVSFDLATEDCEGS
jgi:hypothetical protein